MHQDNPAKVWQLKCTVWQEHWDMKWKSFELRTTNIESENIDSKEEEKAILHHKSIHSLQGEMAVPTFLATFSWILPFVTDPTLELLCPNSGPTPKLTTSCTWCIQGLPVKLFASQSCRPACQTTSQSACSFSANKATAGPCTIAWNDCRALSRWVVPSSKLHEQKAAPSCTKPWRTWDPCLCNWLDLP